MQTKSFEAAVTVRSRSGADATIRSLADMRDYLSLWPGRRGQLYDIAARACDAAAKDYVTMAQARRTLVAFASANGVLRHDLEPGFAASGRAPLQDGYSA